MKCSYHPTVDSVHTCHTCARELCEACSHQIRGNFYCQDCLIRGAEWAAAVKDLRVPKDHAKRAALLALIPGMGAVYNGQYLKAVTYLVVFFSFAEFFGGAAFIFYIFMIFDAYRSAEELQRQRLKEGEGVSIPQRSTDVTSPVWGALLILLGLFLTLINFDIINPERFRKLWPVGIILLGLFLVYKSMGGDKERPMDAGLTERKNN